MAWFVTLASKMIGKKSKEEVVEHLHHFIAMANAMAKDRKWSNLVQCSILEELLGVQVQVQVGHLHAIAICTCNEQK